MEELSIDTSDLKKLAAQLDRSAGLAAAEVRPVVQRGAYNIKKDAQARIGRGPYIPGYAQTITYDSHQTLTNVSAEIGPDKDKEVGGGPYRTPGNLGVFLEYEHGTPWSAPRPHLAPALETEAPKFEKALEAAVLKAIGL